MLAASALDFARRQWQSIVAQIWQNLARTIGSGIENRAAMISKMKNTVA
jgi:hypothetical protein